MPATKRFMNWSGISYTPAGGSATNFSGVTDCSIDPKGSLAKFSGDGDRYTTTVVNDHNEPGATVQSADIKAVLANPVGTVGTFVATLNDARNVVGGVPGTGSITFTLVNAVVDNTPVSDAHRQFGRGTFSVTCFSPDGFTNPISISYAP